MFENFKKSHLFEFSRQEPTWIFGNFWRENSNISKIGIQTEEK